MMHSYYIYDFDMLKGIKDVLILVVMDDALVRSGRLTVW